MKSIYLDNAAATRMDPRVLEEMIPYFTEHYAVASSEFSHSPGILARKALDAARGRVAEAVGAAEEEVIFTSGGTESNNTALKGAALASPVKKHIVCSSIEHNTVLHTCRWLEKHGCTVSYLPVNEEGFVAPALLKEHITDNTFLVTVQHGNQEVGTVQEIEKIGEICREKGVLYHCDASLSFTHEPVDVEAMNIDLLTLSAQKIHGPRGVGALCIRKGTSLEKLIHGGYSEFGRRGGTENVAGAVGFAKAVECAAEEDEEKIRSMQHILIDRLINSIEGVSLNGPEDTRRRLSGNVNVSFAGIEGESVVLHLDMQGVAAITGSACFSKSLEPSYVMMALGYSHERAHGSIRFTLSRFNTIDEMEKSVDVCSEAVASLRKISPL